MLAVHYCAQVRKHIESLYKEEIIMGNERKLHSGTKDPQPSARELAHGRLARKMAAEGFVLLKNDGLLPLEASAAVALFGSGAAYTVKGGIGSGDVNSRVNRSVYSGLKEAQITIVNEGWLKDYKQCYENARSEWKEKVLEDAGKVENPFDAYAANPFSMPHGRKIAEDDLQGASAAIYVLSRIAGEGKDRRRVQGDYLLSKEEERDLLYLNERQMPTVLVLNTGAPVELTDILENAPFIRAVLYLSLPGQEGGCAAADVLFGKSLPGGRLTSTWAKRYEDYPSAEAFGYLNGDLEKEQYKEGIFVGYRYFDSFGIQPLFPFGYGLSYTEFSIVCEEVQTVENGINLAVLVKNTGTVYSGREVVQVYVSLPQTGEIKEYQRLAGFAKTRHLAPQETQRLSITVEQRQMAVFSQKDHAWIIEAGTYGIWTGRHSGCLKLAAVLHISETTVLERTQVLWQEEVDFEQLRTDAADKKRSAGRLEQAAENVPILFFVPKEEHVPARTEAKACPLAQLAQELPVEQLIPLLYGNITQGASTLGSSGVRVPGSAGETTEALEEAYGVRSLIMADGPAGLRLRQSYEVDTKSDTVYGAGVLSSLENGFLEPMEHHTDADTYYQYCTAFPVGTALAQTWDTELMETFGRAVAVEMEEFHVDLWLAPGMNIHRNPLCGRNFEYYSEDPFLSGMMAAAVTRGVQATGRSGVTVKHFACNNQEDNRMGVDVCISERAFREIYLRGFELAIKKSAPAAVMTSYNLINGIHAANSSWLCTVIARKEWGFGGVIMSDWNTTVPQDASVAWKCAAAGNDIIMPGNEADAQDIRQAYARGVLTEESIRSCAGRVMALVEKCMTGKV